MPTVDISIKPKVEHLLNSVKKLSPVELDEFRQKFAEWQQKKDVSVDEDLDADASDDEVLDYIKKNTRLPDQENRRYWELRLKREDTDLDDHETVEYEGFVTKLENMNFKRLEALTILVHRWKKPALDILSENGLIISQFDEPDYYDSISQVMQSET